MQKLKKLKAVLEELVRTGSRLRNYYIPSLWLDPYLKRYKGLINVNPQRFFLRQIDRIEKSAGINPNNIKPQLSEQVVYNMFVRYTTAFDHNNDGKIELEPILKGFRETGTFLKSIAILPYIKSLGATIIYLLPITSIGIYGKKGTLGSPYAIKNPFKIDKNLSEPILGLSVEEEFSAFVEAAHILGIKVVLEFVFRTASRDSDLALERPNWFYWIYDDDELAESFKPPKFKEEELLLIKQKVENQDFEDLPAPDKDYQKLFSPTPRKLRLINNRIEGLLQDNRRCIIPGAFADWPPDDNQPVWSDVTYLRLYEHPDFNYIAYNTVRMYDTKLAIADNKVDDLWDKIMRIVPYYQNKFDIDGVMIDMGHALPSDLREGIVVRARENKKNFIFWEENFVLSKKSADEGYDAVVGYLPFDMHQPAKMKNLINFLAKEGSPIPFFATSENHNTPRAFSRFNDIRFNQLVWAVSCFLPAIPFIHTGFELGEKHPVNTGLDFTDEQIKQYPPENLPLFSESSLNWLDHSDLLIIMRLILSLRDKYLKGLNNETYSKIWEIKCSNEFVTGFTRATINKKLDLAVIFNLNPNETSFTNLKFEKNYSQIFDIFNKRKYKLINNSLVVSLKPFEFIICELSD